MEFTRTIIVDLWKTGVHSIKIGVKKDLEHQAKSRQFTKDAEILGKVDEDNKTKGYLTFRKNPWKAENPNKKLVLKYFSKSMNWKCTLEEMVSKGIAQTLAGKESLPSFFINMANDEYLVYLEKVQKDGSFGKNVYAFGITDPKSRNFYPYTIEENRLTLGSDWTVKDINSTKLAEIDGAKFNMGGKFKIKINTETSTYHPKLVNVLILFACYNRFSKNVEKNLEKTVEHLKDSGEILTLSSQDSMMLLNPRRIAI